MSRDCEDELTSTDADTLNTAAHSLITIRALGSSTSISLLPFISLTRSHSLNTLPPPSGLSLVLRPYDTRHQASPDESLYSLDGGDAEFIAHVAFSEPVRVKAVIVNVGRGEEAPRACKVWVNRAEGIGFDEAQLETPDQEWELQEADEAIGYPTRLSKFHSVSAMTFHFSEPSGGDRSRIFYLGAIGESKQLKKEAAPQLDVRAENAADTAIDRVRAEQGGASTTIR